MNTIYIAPVNGENARGPADVPTCLDNAEA